ncbi:acid protease [Exidia glandulosa HHB12029]|uniref:Acid protease n=1 Tax=Exidia glandulosa HHB12029 TaxID=1314781 RepID=A0A165NKL1_EXIGL|nr:acid protease [Exidia glandulosa HHB12029]
MLTGATLVFLVASHSLLLVQQVQALSLKVHKHHRPATTNSARSFNHNSTGTGRRQLAARLDPEPLDLDNAYDLYYSTDLTIGGQQLSVQLDTGSSELWVRPGNAFTAIQAQVSTNSLSIRYGIGSFTGNITTADVVMGDITIPKQSFLTYTTGAIDNVFKAGLDGMLGLGFDDGSHVHTTVSRNGGGDSGRTLLSNFFVNNPEQPKTMSFAMSRLNDGTDDDGLFMIGEPEPEYAAVKTQPAHPLRINDTPGDFQRWALYLDAIEINGKNITGLQSVVKGAPAGKLVANIDTGTSLGWMPAAAVDAIYKDVPGAVYFSETDQYTVPCMTQLRLAFWFDGVRYPMHPLDVTRVGQSKPDADGNRQYLCTNAFVHMAALAGQTATLDLQLGDSFLRNVISQYDFGDLTDAKTANIRMLTTVPDELAAMNDFLQVRAKQIGVAAPAPVTELPGGTIAGGTPTTSATATSTGTTMTIDPTDAPAPTEVPGTPEQDPSSDGTNSDGSTPETNTPSDTGAASSLAPPLSAAVVLLASLALALW